MAEARTRIASQKVDGSKNTFSIYGEPHPETDLQSIVDTITLDVCDYPADTMLTLAAVGVGRVCEGRWNRKDANNASTIIRAVHEEMKAGTWTPGRVFEEREPDDLTLALAEVQKVPVHLVQQEMDTRMKYIEVSTGKFVSGTPDEAAGHRLYKDAKGRPHKYFDKALKDELTTHPAVAPVLARLIRERAARMTAAARTAKSGPDLSGLFGTPHQHWSGK
jgi:hypothetical protein